MFRGSDIASGLRFSACTFDIWGHHPGQKDLCTYLVQGSSKLTRRSFCVVVDHDGSAVGPLRYCNEATQCLASGSYGPPVAVVLATRPCLVGCQLDVHGSTTFCARYFLCSVLLCYFVVRTDTRRLPSCTSGIGHLDAFIRLV